MRDSLLPAARPRPAVRAVRRARELRPRDSARWPTPPSAHITAAARACDGACGKRATRQADAKRREAHSTIQNNNLTACSHIGLSSTRVWTSLSEVGQAETSTTGAVPGLADLPDTSVISRPPARGNLSAAQANGADVRHRRRSGVVISYAPTSTRTHTTCAVTYQLDPSRSRRQQARPAHAKALCANLAT
jgi:hypothetical protein